MWIIMMSEDLFLNSIWFLFLASSQSNEYKDLIFIILRFTFWTFCMIFLYGLLVENEHPTREYFHQQLVLNTAATSFDLWKLYLFLSFPNYNVNINCNSCVELFIYSSFSITSFFIMKDWEKILHSPIMLSNEFKISGSSYELRPNLASSGWYFNNCPKLDWEPFSGYQLWFM